MTQHEDDDLLGVGREGEAVRIGDFRLWGFWLFLRLAQPTALGAALTRFLEEASCDEINHARYAEIKPESISEIKRNALRSGLDPSATLNAELARAELEQDFEWSVITDQLTAAKGRKGRGMKNEK